MTNNSAVDILLVEDNPHDVELTIRALKKNNLANRIQVIPDGAEALDYFFARGKYASQDTNNQLKIIFLDLKLPKVDGLEVVRQLKSNKQTRSIPVVMLTSSAEERDIAESYQLGVNSYIVKPVDFDNFIHAISEIGFYWLVLNRQPNQVI